MPKAPPEQVAASDLSDQERETLRNRAATRPRSPQVKARSVPGKPVMIDYATKAECVRLAAAFGTANAAFANLMLSDVLNAVCDGSSSRPPSEQAINEALAAVTGIGARDEVEAMLGVQMVATHSAAVTLLRRLKGAENIPQQDSAGSLAVKLLRTYAAQVEALQRYRGKGQQHVTVTHLNVAANQAQVNVGARGDGASPKSEDQPVATAITHAPGQALPSEIETIGDAVPSTSS